VIHISESQAAKLLTPEIAHREVRRILSLWGTERLAALSRVRGTSGGRGLQVLAGLVEDERGGVWAGVKMYTADGGKGRGHTVMVSSPSGELHTVGATQLGALRTAAISGVATEVMHGRPELIGIIGAGYQAERQARALHLLNPAAPIRIWNRTSERAEALAARLRADGANALAVDSVQAATSGADVVTVLTRATEPVLHLRHIGEGTHVNAAGSNHLDSREISADLVEQSTIVVDSLDQARKECGDLVPSLEAGAISWSEIAELGDVVREQRWSKPASKSRTLFESQGMGVLDVALAAAAVHLSTQQQRNAQ